MGDASKSSQVISSPLISAKINPGLTYSHATGSPLLFQKGGLSNPSGRVSNIVSPEEAFQAKRGSWDKT